MSDEQPPDLGISVAEKIKMGEKFGPDAAPPAPPVEAVIGFKANAIGLMRIDEEGKVIEAVHFAYLGKDKSDKNFMKGLRYEFNYRVEVR